MLYLTFFIFSLWLKYFSDAETSTSTVATEFPECPNNTLQNPLTGDWCFQYFNDFLTWVKAEKFCQARGAHLVSVHSQDDNDFLTLKYKEITDPDYEFDETAFWIGGIRKNDTGPWEWSDGSKRDYDSSGFNHPGKTFFKKLAMFTKFYI